MYVCNVEYIANCPINYLLITYIVVVLEYIMRNITISDVQLGMMVKSPSITIHGAS